MELYLYADTLVLLASEEEHETEPSVTVCVEDYLADCRQFVFELNDGSL